MTTQANANQRDLILAYARTITFPENRGDTTAVMAKALPLLEWVEAASDLSDGWTRIKALNHAATSFSNRKTQDTVPPEPHEFLAEATRFYNFMTGGAR